MYKVLALDLDGTLVNSKKELTKRVKDALDELRDNGNHVVLASGRPLAGILPIAKKLEMEKRGGYILSFNGGCVTDCATMQQIHSRNINKEYISPLLEALSYEECVPLSYKYGKIISERDDEKYLIEEANINHLEILKVKSLKDELLASDHETQKILCTAEPENAARITYELAEMFHGRLNIFRSEPYFIEIVPIGTDKGSALDSLMKSMGYTRENLVACGDGLNDLTMINYAGLGVCMANGCEELKNNADYICSSNDEDGVASVVEKFFLC